MTKLKRKQYMEDEEVLKKIRQTGIKENISDGEVIRRITKKLLNNK